MMVTNQQIEAFLQNPENFLYASDWRKEVFCFVPVGREALSQLSFLDNRTLGQSQRKGVVPFDRVFPLKGGFEGKCDFIFHSAFCCSTLLARCLERPGRVLALKEPLAILNLSGLLRSGNEVGREIFPELAETSLRLLARPFSKGERVLIKPSNGANNLIGDILENPACGKVLLLYGPLEDFLVSVITGGKDRQSFIDGILPLFVEDFAKTFKFPEPLSLKPLEKAALAWGLQIKNFSKVAALGAKSVKILNIEDFFSNPARGLEDLNTFFGYGYNGDEIKEILAGPVFTTHAKETHRTFGLHARRAEKKEILERFQKEVKETLDFYKSLNLEISKEFEKGPNP